jgi:hypothetical protein
VQVITQQLQDNRLQWVQKHTNALLASFRKACKPSQQQMCNRAQLQLLSFHARIKMGNPGPVTSAEQKHIFASWPYSVDAWSLFSRCHKTAFPQRYVTNSEDDLFFAVLL